MPLPWAPPDEPWVSPTSPPDLHLLEEIFYHLIAYHNKGPAETTPNDHVQECLEFLIPLLSPLTFNRLMNYSSEDLKRGWLFFNLLVDTYDLRLEISEALKFNSPSRAWFRKNHKFDLCLEPVTFTQITDHTVRLQCYSSALGVGAGLVWSPQVDAAEAVAIKKHIKIEAAHLPGWRWRLEYLYLKRGGSARDFGGDMKIWHDTLQSAMAAYDLIRHADEKPPAPPKKGVAYLVVEPSPYHFLITKD